jgi:hypothetical protein
VAAYVFAHLLFSAAAKGCRLGEITLLPRDRGFAESPPSGTRQRKGLPRAVKKTLGKQKNLDKIWVFRELFLAVDKIGFGESFFLANSYFADRFHLAYGKIYLSILYIYLLYPRQKHL